MLYILTLHNGCSQIQWLKMCTGDAGPEQSLVLFILGLSQLSDQILNFEHLACACIQGNKKSTLLKDQTKIYCISVHVHSMNDVN